MYVRMLCLHERIVVNLSADPVSCKQLREIDQWGPFFGIIGTSPNLADNWPRF